MSKKDRIFVAGHNGLVGSAVLRKLKELNYSNIILAEKKKLNLLDQKKVFNFLKKNKIKSIIICAARVGGIKANNTYKGDFIYENFAQYIEQNIVFNAQVETIDYSGDEVILTTADGFEYRAEKVILTVSPGVLKSNSITFNPSLPSGKIDAIQSVNFLPGFKLFLKFSDQFYPDVISYASNTGEKTIYNIAYGKESNDNVLGLLSTGASAEQYYQMGTPEAIVEDVIQELDGFFNGAASQTYLGAYLMKIGVKTYLLRELGPQTFLLHQRRSNRPLMKKSILPGKLITPLE